MKIGEKIRAFRELKGLTQEQLGKLSGINGGTIRKYELGIRNPKQEQLIKIAKVAEKFHVPRNWCQCIL